MRIIVDGTCGRWSDLNFGSREVKISRASVMVAGELIEDSPKSGKTRKVPQTSALVEKLRAYTAEMRRTDWLFQGLGGSQILADTYRDLFKAATTSIGRPDMTPHNLRDTYAS